MSEIVNIDWNKPETKFQTQAYMSKMISGINKMHKILANLLAKETKNEIFRQALGVSVE